MSLSVEGLLTMVERVFPMAIDVRNKLLIGVIMLMHKIVVWNKMARLVNCRSMVIVSVSRLKFTISNL